MMQRFMALTVAFSLTGCSYRVETDFSKVRVGMTEQELVAQIGPPKQVQEQGAARVLIYETYRRWLTDLSDQSLGRWDRQQMLVRLVNGKIESFTTANRPDSNSGENYASALLSRPMPATDQERAAECNWIRSEMARQQSLAGVGTSIATTPLMAAAYQAAARQNIAALESRAANVQCTAAFNSAQPQSGQSFNQCFSRCQQLTSRTKEQCFDACNK
jgi:hypothetical protein